MARNFFRSISVLLVSLSVLFFVSCANDAAETNNAADTNEDNGSESVQLPMYTLYDDNIADYNFNAEKSEIIILSYCTNITVLSDKILNSNVYVNLYINASLTRIGEQAFDHRTKLLNVVLPDTLQSIGEYAFYSCWNMQEIVLPESLTSIGSYAFSGCDSLYNVRYNGTIEQWNSISKGSSIFSSSKTIICSDGTVKYSN